MVEQGHAEKDSSGECFICLRQTNKTAKVGNILSKEHKETHQSLNENQHMNWTLWEAAGFSYFLFESLNLWPIGNMDEFYYMYE